VSAIDSRTGAAVGSVDIGFRPLSLAVDPSLHLIVAVGYDAHLQQHAAIIDAARMRVSAVRLVGDPGTQEVCDVGDPGCRPVLVAVDRTLHQAYIVQAAHAAAADYFHLLVDRLDALGRAQDAARVREKQGAVLSALARYDEAIATLDEAATASRGSGDLDGFGRVIARIGQVYGRRGTPDQGFARIERSFPVLTLSGATRGLAAAYAALAHLCWLSGRYDEQAVVAAQAAQAARAVGDDRILAWAHLEEGDLTAAANVATRAIDRARAHDHRVVLVDALRISALVSCRTGRCREAISRLDNGLELAAAMPYPLAEARLLHAYSEVESLIAGGSADAPDAARERLEAALTLYERLGARADAALARQDLTALPYRKHLLLNGIVITHGQWARIDALLPPVAPRGRHRADQRRTVAAILYIRWTGRGWADLPPAFGDDSTAHRSYQQWRAGGTWEHIRRIVPSGDQRTMA